jgi:hypothetical protein
MKKLSLLAVVVLALLAPRFARAQGTSTGDPCTMYPKQSATAKITTATTTGLVPAIAGASIYVCDYQILHPGGTGTMALEYGTKVSTDCDTGATVLRGAFAYNTSAGTPMIDDYPKGGNLTGLLVPASNELCALSTGTITQVVTVSYVQR